MDCRLHDYRKLLFKIVCTASDTIKYIINTIISQHTSFIQYLIHVGIANSIAPLHQSNFKIMTTNRYGFLCISFLHHKIMYAK